MRSRHPQLGLVTEVFLPGFTEKKKPLILIDSQDILTALSMSRDEFIDFALLIGTDFTERPNKVGPVAALKHTRKYGSIHKLLENEKNIKLSLDLDAYLEQVEAARHIFTSLPPVPSPSELEERDVDEERLSAIVERVGLSRSMLNESEDKLELAAFGEALFDDDPQTWG